MLKVTELVDRGLRYAGLPAYHREGVLWPVPQPSLTLTLPVVQNRLGVSVCPPDPCPVPGSVGSGQGEGGPSSQEHVGTSTMALPSQGPRS